MTGSTKRFKYIVTSVVAIALAAASLLSTAQQEPLQNSDDNLFGGGGGGPAPSPFDYSVYYVIDALTGEVEYTETGDNSRAIDCTAGWTSSYSSWVTTSQDFLQGYLFDYDALQMKVLLQKGLVRHTYSYTCDTGVATPAKIEDRVDPNSCGEDHKGENKDEWEELTEPSRIMEAFGTDESRFSFPGTHDLTDRYDWLCIVYIAPTTVPAVPYTGRIRLEVLNSAREAIAAESTWPNMVAGVSINGLKNVPSGPPPKEGAPVGNGLILEAVAVPLYVGDVDLPVNGLSGFGHWQARVYGHKA